MSKDASPSGKKSLRGIYLYSVMIIGQLLYFGFQVLRNSLFALMARATTVTHEDQEMRSNGKGIKRSYAITRSETPTVRSATNEIA